MALLIEIHTLTTKRTYWERPEPQRFEDKICTSLHVASVDTQVRYGKKMVPVVRKTTAWCWKYQT